MSPELTELVNDLLTSCYGTRYSVSIDTTRSSANGKKEIETCDVRVLDTEKGREAEVARFSGGQRTIVSESISLALAMIVLRRTGTKEPTLIRDETGSALDEENAGAYISMLRRAAEIIGAAHVIFVSHLSSTWALADARIDISGGKVSVS